MDQQQSGKPRNVLVVCHGNLNRSALAGAILINMLGADRVRDRGLKAIQNRLAAKKARMFAASIELDLTTHRSVMMTMADVEWADVILYMDDSNLRRLGNFPGATEKAKCLASWIGEKRIADPGFISNGPKVQAIFNQVLTATRAAGAEYA